MNVPGLAVTIHQLLQTILTFLPLDIIKLNITLHFEGCNKEDENMINKIQKLLFNTLTLLLLVIFGICWIFTWLVAQDADFFATFPSLSSRIFFLTIGTLLLTIVFFRFISFMDKSSKKQLWIWIGSMFFISVCIYSVLIFSLLVIPRYDSHSMLDQALVFAKSRQTPINKNSVYYMYFTKYSNNYTLTIIFVYYFRLLNFLGIHSFYTGAYVFNSICLLLGNLFTFLIAKRCKGLAFAAKVLFLCTLNPVYYLMSFWVYSNTISVPFMMCIFYLGICIYQSKNYYVRFALSAICMLLVVVAYRIRPTAIFPFIALIFGLFFYTIRKIKRNDISLKRIIKYAILSTLCAAILFGTHTGIQHLNNHYFGNVTSGNYPITHWLMMGSHNDGMYSYDDDKYTSSLENDTKLKETAKQTIEHYQILGSHTVFFWLKKMIILWSDGSFQVNRRLTQYVGSNPITDLILGADNHLLMLYCQMFWLVILLFTMCNLYHQRKEKKLNTYDFLFIVVITGAIALYVIWEVKPEYAIPFLPFFFLYSSNIKSEHLSNWVSLRTKKSKTVYVVMLISFSTIVTFLQITQNNVQKTYEYAIHCFGTSWLDDVSTDNFTQITQTFYPEVDFNRIQLNIRLSEGTTPETNDGTLHIELYNTSGMRILSQDVTAQDITKKNRLTLYSRTQPASTDQSYKLVIYTQNGKHGSLNLRNTKGMDLDVYPGVMTIDGMEQSLDLYMNVYKA